MAKSAVQKLDHKRAALVERTAAALGVAPEEAIRLLAIGRIQSVRVNTLKAPASDTVASLRSIGWIGNHFDWYPDGLSVQAGLDAIRDSQFASDGLVYIQNAASWLPVLVLDPRPGQSVLDVCAAPGGKTSHIAQLSNNQARITANDNSRPRLAKLRANLERLGATNVEYTLYDASYIARRMDGRQFDKILLDAPCSGEGMMRYDRDKDFATWSVAHIKRLQQLQKQLILQAWRLLQPGGTLVYSTCTMAPEENEAVIDYLLRKNPDAHVEPIDIGNSLTNVASPVMAWNGKTYEARVGDTLRLMPSQQVEAFFVAKVTKPYHA